MAWDDVLTDGTKITATIWNSVIAVIGTHKTRHATGGDDALAVTDIGAAPLASPQFTGTPRATAAMRVVSMLDVEGPTDISDNLLVRGDLEVSGNVTIPAGTHSITVTDYFDLDPLGAMIPDTNPASIARAETSGNYNNYVYGLFTQAGDDTNRLQWRKILKEDWDTDGNIEVKFIWKVIAGTAGHKVKWEILGYQFADGDVLDTALVSIGTAEDAIIAPWKVHITTAITPAAISGAAGIPAIFEIKRITSAATETSEDVRLLGATVKYTRTIV